MALRTADLPAAAVVEIRPTSEGSLPGELIRSAYLASRHKPIALVVSDASRAKVDRILDAAILEDVNVKGVVYCRQEELEEFIAQSGAPDFAVVEAPQLRRLLARRSVRLLSPAGAIRVFGRMASSLADQ
jgi:hypothetical protein